MFDKSKALVSLNQKQIETWMKVAMTTAFVAYVIGVFYADSMFISVMQEAFPDNGIFRTLANVGAITTAISAVGILVAKMFWFSSGSQAAWGWFFWIADMVALALNAILAYQIATVGAAALSPTMADWMQLAPATPLIPVIGWGVAIKLDKNQALRQAYLDMDFELINKYREEMTAAIQTEPVQAFLQKASIAAAANALEAQTGMRPKELLEMTGLEDVFQTYQPALQPAEQPSPAQAEGAPVVASPDLAQLELVTAPEPKADANGSSGK